MTEVVMQAFSDHWLQALGAMGLYLVFSFLIVNMFALIGLDVSKREITSVTTRLVSYGTSLGSVFLTAICIL